MHSLPGGKAQSTEEWLVPAVKTHVQKGQREFLLMESALQPPESQRELSPQPSMLKAGDPKKTSHSLKTAKKRAVSPHREPQSSCKRSPALWVSLVLTVPKLLELVPKARDVPS